RDRLGMCSGCWGAARIPSDRSFGRSMWWVRHRAPRGRECARLGTAVVVGLSTARGWFGRADPASRTASCAHRVTARTITEGLASGDPLEATPSDLYGPGQVNTKPPRASPGHESSHETRNHRV